VCIHCELEQNVVDDVLLPTRTSSNVLRLDCLGKSSFLAKGDVRWRAEGSHKIATYPFICVLGWNVTLHDDDSSICLCVDKKILIEANEIHDDWIIRIEL
jgi:hypothetical protein